MPSGTRIRGNNAYGVITDNPLNFGSTTFNSPGLANLPVVSGSNHAVITFDPLRQFNEPEIAIVTAHTSGAQVATIQRGAYGTAARTYPQGTTWVHAPITEDVISILTSSTRPTDPYRGESIFETDTNRYVGRSTVDAWQQLGLFFDSPTCRVFHNANQSIPNGVDTAMVFNSERYDTDTMHSTSINTGRITFNTPGVYVVTFTGEFAVAGDYTQHAVWLRLNGVTPICVGDKAAHTAVAGGFVNATTIYKFAAADYVEAMALQSNGAAAARNMLAAGNYSPEFAAVWVSRGN